VGAPGGRDVALDGGLGPPTCGGVEDEDGVVALGALTAAVDDDAAVVDEDGGVCAGGRREVVDRLGAMGPLLFSELGRQPGRRDVRS
jgi:hypothetical protein